MRTPLGKTVALIFCDLSGENEILMDEVYEGSVSIFGIIWTVSMIHSCHSFHVMFIHSYHQHDMKRILNLVFYVLISVENCRNLYGSNHKGIAKSDGKWILKNKFVNIQRGKQKAFHIVKIFYYC